jgi:type VI protein secretion system component Hcp
MAKQTNLPHTSPRKPLNKKNLKQVRGGGAKGPSVSDITITKVLDKSSPKLT